MCRFGSCLLVCLSLVLPAAVRADSGTNPACAAPEEFVTSDEPLGALSAAIAAGGPVSILALGSATTVGAAKGSGVPTTTPNGTSFPWHMLAALRVALPNVPFQLTVLGGRGMTAEDMLPLLEGALKQRHYALVVWQTGTVEAVRGLRPDGMSDVLHTGVEQVREAGGDVVLVDPQFSRFLRANADLDPYTGVLQQVSTMPGAVLFRRFDLMRVWANDGRIDLERTPKADRDKALDALNTCLGEALARFVLSAVEVQKK